MPHQYLEQPVVVPLQYLQQILGLTKWVPPQYYAPSHGPACSFHKLKSLWLDLASGVEFLVRKNSTLPQKNDQSYQAKRLIIIQNSSFSFVCSYQCIILSTLSNASNFKIIDWFLVKPPSEIFFKVDKLQL